MDDDLIRWKSDTLLRWVIWLVGVHSCALGVAMLAAPRFLIAEFGFPDSALFFPSQSGIFLLILGICYLRALTAPSFVWTIFVSKSLAVLFLLVHVTLLGAPPIIWAAGAGDAVMLVAVALLVHRHGRRPRERAAPILADQRKSLT